MKVRVYSENGRGENVDGVLLPPITVYQSPIGYYIGQFDPDGPYSRLSGYYGTYKKADVERLFGWEPRRVSENLIIWELLFLANQVYVVEPDGL